MSGMGDGYPFELRKTHANQLKTHEYYHPTIHPLPTNFICGKRQAAAIGSQQLLHVVVWEIAGPLRWLNGSQVRVYLMMVISCELSVKYNRTCMSALNGQECGGCHS